MRFYSSSSPSLGYYVLLVLAIFLCTPIQAFRPSQVAHLSFSKLRAGAKDAISPRASSSGLQAWPLQDDPKGVPPEFPLAVARVGITTAATVLTWYAAQNRGGAVLASSAVTLICSLVAPGLGQAAMCGSFAGMANGNSLVPTFPLSVVLGGITSILFEIMIHTRNMFLGMGGRLGFTAFVGVNVFALARGIPLKAAATGLGDAPWLPMAGFGALGSVATIALREASDDASAADPVRAAAVIGLLTALLVGFQKFTDMGALAVYGGAFVGMSLPSRLMRGRVPGAPSETGTGPSAGSLLASFAVTGALGGLVHALTFGHGWWMGGWGGKAGFCSFVGVLLYRGMARTATALKSLTSGNE